LLPLGQPHSIHCMIHLIMFAVFSVTLPFQSLDIEMNLCFRYLHGLSAHAQDHHFVIYDLHFDCVYVVRLQDGADRVSGHVLLTTPSCDHVTVVGDVTPDCPPKGRHTVMLLLSKYIYKIIVNET